ncbi:MAG: hypothetical protein IJ463_00815 [Bacilli bacterium]|nr:hypothetical protein [Bacilli bacterium]
MKKIVKLFILALVVFLPLIGDAKTNFTFEWEKDDGLYVGSVNGEYIFYNRQENILKVYDKDGVFVENLDFPIGENIKTSEFYEDEILNLLFYRETGCKLQYNSDLDKFYYVDPKSPRIVVLGEYSSDSVIELSFSNGEDIEEIKKLIGIEYDIIKSIFDANLAIDGYYYDEDYYIVWCYNESYDYYKVFNKDGELVYSLEFLYEDAYKLHVYDDRIYLMTDDTKIDIYDFDKKLLDSFDVSDKVYEFHPNDDIFLDSFYIKDNNLIFLYAYQNIEPVSDMGEGIKNRHDNKSIFDYTKYESNPDNYFALKYKLTHDMTLVTEKTGGSFTAERKVDEFDREYVELKITTQEGYVVNTITVKDIHGNEIEVIDNKFYMPGSDVVVSVTYKQGEYLPIPDTGLSQSITIILIGLILISLGAYTINYVRQE